MAATAPLVNRPLDDPIAFLGRPLPVFGCDAGPVSVREFLAQVTALADQLPAYSYAINLCENRYHFLLSFCAVIVRGQTNLLPPNRGTETQRSLAQRYADCYVLHDGLTELADIHAVNLLNLTCTAVEVEMPSIHLDHLAAIAFTSGSTGESQANRKPWRTFVDSTAINAHHMLEDAKMLYHGLATVPGQHMWGLETTILMALMAPLCIDDGKPLFPQDIADRLARLPEPRLLVSTPVHLRSLCVSGITFPQVERILCATAPLSTALATDVEKLLRGRVREVFGCSEVGSMACRNTADTEVWELFSGLHMNRLEADGSVTISADHLPESVVLQDNVERFDARHFRLLGRGSDMLEIAGKRGSLMEMNSILQSHPDVADAAVFLPEQDGPVQRLAALVSIRRVSMSEPESKADLVDYLRKRVDSVFIPRPILIVDALPREENGKLPRKKLLDFYQKIKKN